MGKSKDFPIKSKRLRDLNTIDINGLAKKFSDRTFWYYTSLETANLILQNRCFYINNLTQMNDKEEADIHELTANKIYALCMCNSKSEKIPMWYLYSGLTGKGVSIGFTPAVMLEFIRSIDRVSCVDDKTELLKDVGFSLDAAWVYYKEFGTNRVYFKNKWYSVSDAENFFVDNNVFVKNYSWEYEKEFRIVIKTNDPPKDSQKLSISIPDSIVQKLKIRLAPELSMNVDDLEKFVKRELKGSVVTGNVTKSGLKIRMGLFERNIKNLKDSWKTILEEKSLTADDYLYFYEGIKPYLTEHHV